MTMTAPREGPTSYPPNPSAPPLTPGGSTSRGGGSPSPPAWTEVVWWLIWVGAGLVGVALTYLVRAMGAIQDCIGDCNTPVTGLLISALPWAVSGIVLLTALAAIVKRKVPTR